MVRRVTLGEASVCLIYAWTSLGQLVKVIKETQMNLVVDSLVVFIGGKDDELRDIAGLGE